MYCYYPTVIHHPLNLIKKVKLIGTKCIPDENRMAEKSSEMYNIKILLVRISYILENQYSRNQ